MGPKVSGRLGSGTKGPGNLGSGTNGPGTFGSGIKGPRTLGSGTKGLDNPAATCRPACRELPQAHEAPTVLYRAVPKKGVRLFDANGF